MKAIFSPLAEKQLKKLSKITQIIIAKKVRQLRDEIYSNIQALTGYKGIYRVRIGDYRLVLRKYPNKIYFILVGHRKNNYLLAKKLLG